MGPDNLLAPLTSKTFVKSMQSLSPFPTAKLSTQRLLWCPTPLASNTANIVG